MHHVVDLLSLSNISRCFRLTGHNGSMNNKDSYSFVQEPMISPSVWPFSCMGNSCDHMGGRFIGELNDASHVRFSTISPVSRVNNCYILLVALLLLS